MADESSEEGLRDVKGSERSMLKPFSLVYGLKSPPPFISSSAVPRFSDPPLVDGRATAGGRVAATGAGGRGGGTKSRISTVNSSSSEEGGMETA